jgi:opacity protein-like surface antigen
MRVLSILALLAMTAGSLAMASAAESETGSDATGGNLTVAEIAVGTGYDSQTRNLTGAAEVFPAGTEKLWCRTRIQGATAPTSVTHVWYHRDQTVARVELNVGSADWRTVSSKNLLPEWTGPWEIKVLDAGGTVLQTVRFTIE